MSIKGKGRALLILLAAGPCLVVYGCWAIFDAAREIWRSDIVPAWRRL